MPIKKKITSAEVDVETNILDNTIEKETVKKTVTKITTPKAVSKVKKATESPVTKEKKLVKKATSPKAASKVQKATETPVEKEINTDKKEIDCIANAMLDKKASFVCSLDLLPIGTGICDYFVICNADSTAQVTAIADNVEDMMHKECKRKAIRMQGKENAFWIIIDYGNIVVHIFQTEYRQFYRLEDLWGDAKKTIYQD